MFDRSVRCRRRHLAAAVVVVRSFVGSLVRSLWSLWLLCAGVVARCGCSLRLLVVVAVVAAAAAVAVAVAAAVVDVRCRR